MTNDNLLKMCFVLFPILIHMIPVVMGFHCTATIIFSVKVGMPWNVLALCLSLWGSLNPANISSCLKVCSIINVPEFCHDF